MKKTLRAVEHFDEKDWLILRLLIAVRKPNPEYSADFVKACVWVSDNLDIWPRPSPIDELIAEGKRTSELYAKVLKHYEKTVLIPQAMQDSPLVVCMAIDSGEDQ